MAGLRRHYGVADAVTAWLDVRGEEPGALLLHRQGRQRRGELDDRPSRAAHPAPPGLGSGRRPLLAARVPALFISDMLDVGAHIATVQSMTGHATLRPPPGMTAEARS